MLRQPPGTPINRTLISTLASEVTIEPVPATSGGSRPRAASVPAEATADALDTLLPNTQRRLFRESGDTWLRTTTAGSRWPSG